MRVKNDNPPSKFTVSLRVQTETLATMFNRQLSSKMCTPFHESQQIPIFFYSTYPIRFQIYNLWVTTEAAVIGKSIERQCVGFLFCFSLD